jgi:hypothetical protein
MKNYKEKIFKKIRKVKILYQIYIITGIKGLVYALKKFFIFTDSTLRSLRGRDRMVVGFITTYVISAYHH